MFIRFFALASMLFLAFGAAVPPARAASPSATGDEILLLKKSEPDKLFILDVRTPGEYWGGHIQGAVLIPISDVTGKLSSIPKNRKIIVVCASGARSGAVASYLIDNGYQWVKNYSGGMFDWTRRGLPVVQR